MTDGNGNRTDYAYDTTGNVATITAPAPLGARQFSYDAAGRIASETDGRGNTVYYSYDNDDRLTQVSYSNGSCPTATCVKYVYDDDGNEIKRVSSTGTWQYVYDGLNRPTKKKLGTTAISTVTYDADSNMTSYNDSAGTVTYVYDIADRLVFIAEPGGSCPTDYRSQPQYPNTTKCTQIKYNAANQRTQINYPNGQYTQLSYDGGRIASIAAHVVGNIRVIAARTYTYNHGSGSTATHGGLRDTVYDNVLQTRHSYTYDGMDRLQQDDYIPGQTGGTPTNTQSWKYDNDGNRLTATDTTPGVQTRYSAFNAANELCWTKQSSTALATNTCTPPAGAGVPTYDSTGNQTSDTAISSTYNVFDQVNATTGGTANTSYTYNDTSSDERATSTIGTTTTNFLNGTLGLSAQTTSGTTTEFVRDPYGNLIAMEIGSASYYYTTDAQGSVLALTDSTAATVASYTYDAWGTITAASGTLANTNPWRYATGYYDAATGYTKLGDRYYNPTVGAFTQDDPKTPVDGGYTYAGDDPANNTDPSGRDWLSGIGAVLGAVTGFGSGAALGEVIGGAVGSLFGPEGTVLGAELGTAIGASVGSAVGCYGAYTGIDDLAYPDQEGNDS